VTIINASNRLSSALQVEAWPVGETVGQAARYSGKKEQHISVNKRFISQ
jgi:hypothetical protein